MTQDRTRYDQRKAMQEIYLEFPELAEFDGGLNVQDALLLHFKGGLYRIWLGTDVPSFKDVRTPEQREVGGPITIYEHLWPFKRTFYLRDSGEFWGDTLPEGWVVPVRRFTPLVLEEIFRNWPELF